MTIIEYFRRKSFNTPFQHHHTKVNHNSHNNYYKYSARTQEEDWNFYNKTRYGIPDGYDYDDDDDDDVTVDFDSGIIPNRLDTVLNRNTCRYGGALCPKGDTQCMCRYDEILGGGSTTISKNKKSIGFFKTIDEVLIGETYIDKDDFVYEVEAVKREGNNKYRGTICLQEICKVHRHRVKKSYRRLSMTFGQFTKSIIAVYSIENFDG